jgi:hypothetical protein
MIIFAKAKSFYVFNKQWKIYSNISTNVKKKKKNQYYDLDPVAPVPTSS